MKIGLVPFSFCLKDHYMVGGQIIQVFSVLIKDEAVEIFLDLRHYIQK